jgi:UDP-glucose 4-epimerase
MTILVTGGAGYIGSIVVNRLIKKHKIIVVDDLSSGFKQLVHPQAKFIKCNFLDRIKLNNVFARNKIDLVIHLGAKIVVPESVEKPSEYFENNVMGTLNIINVMRQHQVKNIIFASSAAVYGQPKKIPVKENDIKNPCNPYGQSKLADEFVITSAHDAYGINYHIFRFFNVGGASDDGQFGMMKPNPTLLIPAVNRAILSGQKPFVFGNKYKTKDGTCLRDYVHVEDLAYACELAIPRLQKNQSGIYNLGCNKGYTVLDVIKTVAEVNHLKSDYILKPKRLGDPDALLTSIALAKSELR